MLRTLVITVFFAAIQTAPLLAQEFDFKPDHITSEVQVEELASGGLGAADTGSVRELSVLAMALLKDFEGWEPRAYDDAAKYCTIGYGHLIDRLPCRQIGNLGQFAGVLDEAAGETLLAQDARLARRAVAQLVTVSLNDDEFGALSSFVFNVGKTNFQSSTLLRLLNGGDHAGAAKQFMRWVKAGGQTWDGLINRRSCEKALFEGNVTLTEGKFIREDCMSLGAAPSGATQIDISVGE